MRHSKTLLSSISYLSTMFLRPDALMQDWVCRARRPSEGVEHCRPGVLLVKGYHTKAEVQQEEHYQEYPQVSDMVPPPKLFRPYHLN